MFLHAKALQKDLDLWSQQFYPFHPAIVCVLAILYKITMSNGLRTIECRYNITIIVGAVTFCCKRKHISIRKNISCTPF